MSRYKAYGEYRDSGVEWLGTIPSHWKCIRFKYVVDLVGDKIESGSDIKYVGLENIESKSGKYIEKEDVKPEGQSTSFSKGDVLFGKLRPYLAKSWVADFSGICSSEFLVTKSRVISPRFLNYYTLTEEFVNQVDSSTYGSKMPRANWDFIALLNVTIPTSESENIANFLDHETAKINTLIEKQHQLIKLLKEKRQAVISHAVTKGLNPNAPMRDSGVEWLGEVPKNWQVMQLKRCVEDCVNGLWGDEPSNNEDNTVVIRVADFNRARLTINNDGYTYRKIEKKEKINRILKYGDLLLEKSGGGEKTLVGQVVLFDKDFEAVTSNFVAKMTPISSFESRYLNYVFSRFYNDNINYCSIKQNTGIQNLDSHSYLSEKFGFPAYSEQIQIANFLDHETAKIDILIEKQQQLIKLLQERRTALISAAVTGKIDVRDWQSSTSPIEQEAFA